jgi:hypothetical protein
MGEALRGGPRASRHRLDREVASMIARASIR